MKKKKKEKREKVLLSLTQPRTIVQYYRNNGIPKGVFIAIPGIGETFNLGFTLCKNGDKFDREKGKEDALVRAVRWNSIQLVASSSFYEKGAGIIGEGKQLLDKWVIIPESILADLTAFATKAARVFKKQSPRWIRNFVGLVDLTPPKDWVRQSAEKNCAAFNESMENKRLNPGRLTGSGTAIAPQGVVAPADGSENAEQIVKNMAKKYCEGKSDVQEIIDEHKMPGAEAAR